MRIKIVTAIKAQSKSPEFSLGGTAETGDDDKSYTINIVRNKYALKFEAMGFCNLFQLLKNNCLQFTSGSVIY